MRFHIQIPRVQDYTVLPMVNPFIFPKNLLARKDFPERYGPAMATTATFFCGFDCSSRDIASVDTTKRPESSSI